MKAFYLVLALALALTLIPVAALAQGADVVLIITNQNPLAAATVTVDLFDAQGFVVGQAGTVTIPPGGQGSITIPSASLSPSISYSAQANSDQPIAVVVSQTGDNGLGITYNTPPTSSGPVVFPMVNPWTGHDLDTSFLVHNAGEQSQQVQVTYYDLGGNQVADTSLEIPAHGSAVYPAGKSDGGPLNDDFQGWAYFYAPDSYSVVASGQTPGGQPWVTEGLPAGSIDSREHFVKIWFDPDGTMDVNFNTVNVSGTPAEIFPNFYDPDGNNLFDGSVFLPGWGGQGWSPDDFASLTGGTNYSLKMVTPGGSPLAGARTDRQPDGRLNIFNAANYGVTEADLGWIVNNYFKRSSNIRVQNAGFDPAQATVGFIDAQGNTIGQVTQTIGPGATTWLDTAAHLGDTQFNGWARITSPGSVVCEGAHYVQGNSVVEFNPIDMSPQGLPGLFSFPVYRFPHKFDF